MTIILSVLGLIFVFDRLVNGEWAWQTSAKSSRSTRSSPSKPQQLRQLSLYERTPLTGNSSRRGANGVRCNCFSGYICMACASMMLAPKRPRKTPPYVCTDPTCCPPDYDINDARLAEVKAQQERAKLKREQAYREHVASLGKLSGAVRMFRTWKLLPDGSLKAMTQEHTWKPGENVTLASGGDASKDSGFYGFAGLPELKRQEDEWWRKSQAGEPKQALGYDSNGTPIGYKKDVHYYVCGTMLCYGHVKISEKGGRAQKAWPEYIIEPDGSDPDFGMLVVNAAERYGMQIITVADAEELETGVVPWVKEEKK